MSNPIRAWVVIGLGVLLVLRRNCPSAGHADLARYTERTGRPPRRAAFARRGGVASPGEQNCS
jgi:hypothetical protein